MGETQTLHFRYHSPENFCRLLVTINYENTHKEYEDIYVFHNRFKDGEEADNLFRQFLEKLFPDGGTINVEEIDQITKYVDCFLQTDEEAKQIRLNYKLQTCKSYVYFIPDKTFVECRFGEHSRAVYDICYKYFEGYENLTVEYLRSFLKKNFKIVSDNTSIERIINDSNFILKQIEWRNAI